MTNYVCQFDLFLFENIKLIVLYEWFSKFLTEKKNYLQSKPQI